MKKLLIALAAGAAAIGTYAATAINGAGFDTADTSVKYSWSQDGDFDTDIWSGITDGVMTREAADCGWTENRPSGYQSDPAVGLGGDGYMKIKTTLGNPVLQRATAETTTLLTDDGFFYDGLVQFTAFDEMPDMSAYLDAKIGLFPMVESEEDNAKAFLYVYAQGGTNYWKTTKEIDGAWHRVTIKMIKNVTRTASATKVGYVIFIDGTAVDCMDAQVKDVDLNPAAKAWNDDGKLFLSMDDDNNEFEGVAYDGQGALDEVGFTDLDGAPDWAKDAEFGTVTWTSGNIAKVYIVDGDNNAVADSLTSPVDFQKTAGKSYYYYYDAVSGYIGKGIADKEEITESTVAIDEEPAKAAFDVGGAPYATWADAVAAASGDVTITLAEDYTMDDDDLAASINNETGLTTIDFAGNVLTGTVIAATEIKFIDSESENAGGIAGVGGEGERVAVDSSAIVTIEGGKFDGWIYLGNADEKTISAGIFLEQDTSAGDFYLVDYVADDYKPEYDKGTGYWTIVEDTAVDFTVTAGDKSTAVVKINDEVVELIPEKLEKDDTYEVTFKANDDYAFDPAAQTVFSGTAGAEPITITGPDATRLPTVAVIGQAEFTSLAKAVAAARPNEMIDLRKDYTLLENETVLIPADVTVNLNEFTLTTTAWHSGDKHRFGFAENAVGAVIQGGTVALADGSYGFQICKGASAFVACTVTKTTGVVFDIYGATLFCDKDTDVSSNGDLFRFKEVDVTSYVCITGGKYWAKASNAPTASVFHHYKQGHTAKIQIMGGEFKCASYLIDVYQADKQTGDPILNFVKKFGADCAVSFYLGNADHKLFSPQKLATAEAPLYTDADLIADGYELVADTAKGEGWFKIAAQASPVQPVKPGEDIPADDPAAKAAEINDDPALKAKLLKAPCELEAADLATYQALFVAAPNAAGTGVTFVLEATAAEDLTEAATADAAEALTGDSISITPVKGLYYGLKEAGALDSMKVTDAELATGDAITFTPDKTGNAAFWQVIVSPTVIKVENAD